MRKNNLLYFKWTNSKANLQKADYKDLGWKASPFSFHKLEGPPHQYCNICGNTIAKHAGLSFEGKITGEILCPGDWVVYPLKSRQFRVVLKRETLAVIYTPNFWE